ncbi:hypothetical protein IWX90DRAFT_250221 [Phyllosticta citrichinensis]|uniref:Uncharacterized protein n=1 Tax=Phyllosticta citrichinensis TaxID=1130410 RepID=A0ABR1XRH4_9PEZI
MIGGHGGRGGRASRVRFDMNLGRGPGTASTPTTLDRPGVLPATSRLTECECECVVVSGDARIPLWSDSDVVCIPQSSDATTHLLPMMTAVNSLDLIHPGVAALVVALVRPQASAQHRNRLPLLPHGACHTTRSWSLGRSAVPGSAHPMLPRAPVPCRPCLFYPTLQGRLAAASFSEQRVLHGSFIRMLPPPPCPPNLLLSIHQHVNFAIRSVCFDAAVGTSATAVENNSRMLYAPRAKKPLRITENADRLTACAVAPTNPTPNQPGSRPDTRIPRTCSSSTRCASTRHASRRCA